MQVTSSNLFATQFQAHKRVFQNPGSGERILYTSRLNEDGTIDLVPSGKDNLYAFIQSHKDSCDIHVLLARYANGDVDALSRAQGAYGDFSQMPTTYAELLNSVIQGEAMFNSLPVEVREKFDHSFEKFMVAMDDMPSFLEKMGYKQDVPSAEPSAEVATSENVGNA
uniref:Internal scaffolding protein n=1 Tax=Dulem virus 128 TaxID=3145605 RepID=A0AAU8B7C3_9VIRU